MTSHRYIQDFLFGAQTDRQQSGEYSLTTKRHSSVEISSQTIWDSFRSLCPLYIANMLRLVAAQCGIEGDWDNQILH